MGAIRLDFSPLLGSVFRISTTLKTLADIFQPFREHVFFLAALQSQMAPQLVKAQYNNGQTRKKKLVLNCSNNCIHRRTTQKRKSDVLKTP